MKEKPRDSSLRDAFVGILMTVGPFFGVRYRPPRVEIPVVTTPATGASNDVRAAQTSARAAEAGRDEPDAGGAVV